MGGGIIQTLKDTEKIIMVMWKDDIHNWGESNSFLTSPLKIYDWHSDNRFCLLILHTTMSDILAEQQTLCWRKNGKKMQSISPYCYSSSHHLHEIFTIFLNDFGTKYICISSALTGRILICPSHNINPPVALCLSESLQIVQSIQYTSPYTR